MPLWIYRVIIYIENIFGYSFSDMFFCDMFVLFSFKISFLVFIDLNYAINS